MMIRISIFLAMSLAVFTAPIHAQEEPPVALVGGMLLDGYEGPAIHHATVVIQDNRIIAVGPSDEIDIPENAVIIDTRGRTIMPGLIDLHIHLDLIGHGDYDRYYEFIGGMARLDDVMPIAAKQMMRAGVTTGVDLGSPFQILDVRERIRAGDIPGPRLVISGPWITRVRLDGVPDEYQIIVNSPDEARAATRRLIEQGSDVIKTWLGLTQEELNAVVDEAHKSGVKVHSHLYRPAAIRMALDAGVDVLQHVGSARNPAYSEELVMEIAHRNIPIVQTMSHRIWVYPATLAFPERLHDPVLERDMPADIYAEVIDSFIDWHRLSYFNDIGQETRHSKRSSRQFIEAGAYMGVGTDAASPLNFHTEAMWREMSALVDSGMTNLQVISAATKVGAEIIGRARDLGTVEPGKLADIIVVDGNPLETVKLWGRVDIVIKDGEIWFDEGAVTDNLKRVGKSF